MSDLFGISTVACRIQVRFKFLNIFLTYGAQVRAPTHTDTTIQLFGKIIKFFVVSVSFFIVLDLFADGHLECCRKCFLTI